MEENKEQINEEVLELRMFFFVPYNISDKQKGIQALHAALRYARKYHQDNPQVWDFVDNHETVIILDGGTTNDQIDIEGLSIGGINKIGDSLSANEIDFSWFREPDLNGTLTSICFICDERVFNRKDYPDFKFYLIDRVEERLGESEANRLALFSEENLINSNLDYYNKWLELIGGKKNEFLRNLIKDKNLA
jgi:hypothetical protein